MYFSTTKEHVEENIGEGDETVEDDLDRYGEEVSRSCRVLVMWLCSSRNESQRRDVGRDTWKPVWLP